MTIQNRTPPPPGQTGLFFQDPTGCLLGRHHQPHQTRSTPHDPKVTGLYLRPAVAGHDSPVSPPMSNTPPTPNVGRTQARLSSLRWRQLLRKEVIQPHLPVRLPCYDFVPIASPTFDGSLPQGVGPPASGVADFRDVTGGVYKARERIHRSVADLRLLATPTSRGRVADPDPN